MLNSAIRAETADEAEDRGDLERAATALVRLDAWCRQRGLDALSERLAPAIDWSDQTLTGSDLTR